MTNRVITSTQTQEEEIRSRLRIQLERDGGNPSQLLELIMIATKHRVWESFDMSFEQFIETPFNDGGLGWSVQNLKTVLALKHRFEHEKTGHKDLVSDLANMRKQVMDLLEPLGAPGNPSGRNQYSEPLRNFDNYQNSSEGNDKRKQSVGGGGTSEEYTKARLRRDNPDLYERVESGEMSANAAAKEAGWRKSNSRYQLPTDPTVAGRYLAQRVDQAWLMECVDAFMKACCQ